MPARAQQSETQGIGPIAPDADFQTRLIEGSPDCIKVLDLDGRLLSMSAGGMKLLEICDLRPFVGQSWLEFWKGADREAAEAAIKAAREGDAGRFVGFLPTTQTHKRKWFDVIVSPIVDSSGKPEKILAASRDITDYKRAERSLRAIAEGTAAATGDEFFRSLARCAAQALGAQYAFVAETLSEMESRSLAFWEGTDFGAGFTYRFPGTPCQRVAAGHVCVTPSGLQEKFPEDLWLQQIGAQSYVGVPLRDAQGRTLGHLAVLHREPMEPSEEDIATLQIFAARGCAELERKHANEKLSKAHADLRRLNLETAALLNVNRAIGHHLHRDVLFGALADCLQTVVPNDRFGIVLPHEGSRLQVYILTQRDARSESLQSTICSAEGTATQWVLENREVCRCARDEMRDRFPTTERVMKEAEMQSLCELPLVTGSHTLGSLFFMASAKAAYGHLQQTFLEQVASAVAVALDDCLAHEEMRRLGDELSARKIAELEKQQRRMSDALQETSKALDASEERFRDLFDEAPIAYVHEGLDSRFIRANRTAMRILGIKPEDVPTTYGKTFAPDTPDAQRRMREAFESIGRGTDTSGVVLEMRRKDNGKPFWIQWWSRPDPSGTYTRTMFLDITDRVLMEQEKARLEAQNIYLQEEIRSQHNFVEIVGNSRPLLAVLRQVDQVAPTDATALIVGETGTGKELIARAIHDRSPRHERPLVKVNCGAISAGLVESELFGHVKGAFTGALVNRDGRFVLADGGTIFLDEVGELPPDTQVKLLRVLQEQEFEPIGSSKTIKVNVRVIAATNRDLSLMVREGKFRSDLFYRLNVFPLTMPPLRERQEDVPLLTMFFLEKYARKLGRPISHVTEETMSRLCAYSWPGNIRELQNVIERAVVLSKGPALKIEGSALFDFARAEPLASIPPRSPTLASPPASASNRVRSLEEVERQHIVDVLTQANWRIEGDRGAAKLLNLQPSTLRSRMQKLSITRRLA
jgi:formate hydrogenlyase transcriptional activator